MNYFLVTTTILKTTDEEKYEKRKQQYIVAIQKLKDILSKSETEYKIIIIENNGFRPTYLDELDCEVFYTENNLNNNEKGYKELKDVLDCIEHYHIQDDDFITKMTGRYILEETSQYLHAVLNLHKQKYDCIIKYIILSLPVDYRCEDCMTGLVGMRCRYVKQIQFPNTNECVEWKWAKASYLIDEDKICKLQTLGILICAGLDNYDHYFII